MTTIQPGPAVLGKGDGRYRSFGFFRAGGAVFLVEQGPADHSEDDTAGELHGGQSDAEEGENGGADEFDDGEEDDGVDGDPAGEGTVGVDGRVADETEEDQRGAKRVDHRQKRTEAQTEEFPEKKHGVT
jgi:hypothetical protein